MTMVKTSGTFQMYQMFLNLTSCPAALTCDMCCESSDSTAVQSFRTLLSDGETRVNAIADMGAALRHVFLLCSWRGISSMCETPG